MKTLYETDFYAWTQQQSELLKLQAWDQLDALNLIEELESLGVTQCRSQIPASGNVVKPLPAIGSDSLSLATAQDFRLWCRPH